ncbi:hypothetical protein FA95DRAFT_1609462 [Auriscalpium vulgare]|uniref:Uncharacterized protein n=1 Tax=Auriscalpium vulgare TaxID=40419 RepID=A0ACB8RGK1_9AGAM|nr:hypothetical protein FA95DRAFT_1609462 [Auriscalpium vulgare]
MPSISTEINPRSAISRLPPELLGLVFSHLVEDETEQRLRLQDRTAGLKWSSVTHVCQRWRQIAFENPHLWRHIVFPTSSEHLLDEFLLRSQRIPLVVSWVWDNSKRFIPLPSTALALKTLDRVERVSIVNFGGNVYDLSGLLVTPAPLLEAVEVGFWYDSQPIRLPSALFADHAPRLRYISLRNVAPFPWSSPFPGIVSLKLKGPSLTPQSVSELLSSLRSMPLLEVLELERCLPVFSQDVPAAADMVAPGHLRKLCLDDDVGKCVAFLQHLRMPQSSVIIYLHCDSLGDVAPFPWSSPFPGIVSLKLKGPSLTPPSMHRLFDSLRSMPLLEVLELEHCLPVFSQDVSAADDMVALGHLKKLSLDDYVWKCAGFLQHLRMPQSSVLLHLNCDMEDDATAFRALYPYIAAASFPQPITSMEIESSERGEIMFRGYRGDAGNICNGPDKFFFYAI